MITDITRLFFWLIGKNMGQYQKTNPCNKMSSNDEYLFLWLQVSDEIFMRLNLLQAYISQIISLNI